MTKDFFHLRVNNEIIIEEDENSQKNSGNSKDMNDSNVSRSHDVSSDERAPQKDSVVSRTSSAIKK